MKYLFYKPKEAIVKNLELLAFLKKKKKKKTFTKRYRTMCRFEKSVLNYQTSQTGVFKFPKGYSVKVYC
jgi:Iap family predicted aminopeptidase